MPSPTVDVTIPAGVPLSFHFYQVGGKSKVVLHLSDSDDQDKFSSIVCEPRSLFALHAMLGEALDKWRADHGEVWAELFPPELDLGVEAA